MIGFYDTETTGLPLPMGAPLDRQPHIIEVFVALTDDDLEVQDTFHSLIKPPVPIPEYITKITGINDLDVYGEPPIKKVFPKLRKLWKKMEMIVAQNWMFDYTMMELEAQRLEKQLIWPRPYCTVEQSLFVKGRRLKQTELYEHFIGGEYNAHRAEDDVMAMIEIFKSIRRIG